MEQALARKIEHLAVVAKQLAVDAHAAKARGETFPFVQRFVQACYAAMAELGFGEYKVSVSSTHPALVPPIVVTGGLTMAPMGMSGSVAPAPLLELPEAARKRIVSWQLF